MGTLTTVLQRAHARATESGLPYSGAVTPEEAQLLWQQAPGAQLVDVRSAAEWQFTGIVPGALLVELRSYPGMVINPHFMEQLRAKVDPEGLILFLCRSGARSDAAARIASEAGFTNCYNVLEGFEGDRSHEGHRNTINGWRARGLPWEQS
jgi:rhodanese-related sulfurtransferase